MPRAKGRAPNGGFQRAVPKSDDRKPYKFFSGQKEGLYLLWHLGDILYNPNTGEYPVVNRHATTAKEYGIERGASGRSNPAQKWRDKARRNCNEQILVNSGVPCEKWCVPEIGIYPPSHENYGKTYQQLGLYRPGHARHGTQGPEDRLDSDPQIRPEGFRSGKPATRATSKAMETAGGSRPTLRCPIPTASLFSSSAASQVHQPPHPSAPQHSLRHTLPGQHNTVPETGVFPGISGSGYHVVASMAPHTSIYPMQQSSNFTQHPPVANQFVSGYSGLPTLIPYRPHPDRDMVGTANDRYGTGAEIWDNKPLYSSHPVMPNQSYQPPPGGPSYVRHDNIVLPNMHYGSSAYASANFPYPSMPGDMGDSQFDFFYGL